MDAKITKLRLSRMLSYDWLKMVGFALAAILVWSLIFTMTATRITPAQQFTVFNYMGNVSLSSTNFYDSYNKAFQSGVFSYEVIEINENDLTVSEEMVNTLLEARLGTDEGDVMFIANVNDPKSKQLNEETGETTYSTYMEEFVSGWARYVADLDPNSENGYFRKLENYLGQFYADWTDKTTLNEQAVEDAFRARIKKNKDKRFKKANEIEKGIEDDVERIQKYRDALEQFYSYLDAGVIEYTQVKVPSYVEGEEPQLKTLGINLCPNTETMDDLKKIVCYQTTVKETDEDGKEIEKIRVTAEDMNVMFFNLPGVEEGFQYESLLFVNYVIESSLKTPSAQNN